MEKPLLTIGIPTYNNWRQLYDCLLTLTRYTEFPFHIVVVNNGDERNADGVRLEDDLYRSVGYPWMTFVQAERNLGWQGGVNRAFREAPNTEFFAMCNDDILFLPWNRTFWRQLGSWFRYSEVGAVGPATNFVMGSQSLFDHRGGAAFETTLLIGFLMMVRSKAFAEIGGLDEGLIGGDDLDLSILLRKKGCKLIVDRTCYVHHIGAQTGPRVTGDYWNTSDHVDETNNALIRKHGVRAWYDCVSSKIWPFADATATTDQEGDTIRSWLSGEVVGMDLGCGANKTVDHAVGVDITPKGQCGVAGGTKGVESVADLTADITALPVEDGSQEFLVARHILEHLIDPVAALEEWKRVLQPGGKLLVALPDEEATSTILWDWSHLHAYTRASACNLLEAAGFEVRDVRRLDPGISFCVMATKPPLYKRKAVDALGVSIH